MCLQERREIEKALFNGDLLGVAATNALELGVDVGGLDMTMHLGFQGPSSCIAANSLLSLCHKEVALLSMHCQMNPVCQCFFRRRVSAAESYLQHLPDIDLA